MRRLLAVTAYVLLLAASVMAAEDVLRLEGIAYTEGAADEIQVQVWALGGQVAEHPEWQLEAVFDGNVTAGKAFSIDLGEARLPVLVELAARGHAAVSLQVVLPEQLQLPPAWLRKGEPVRLRVGRPDRGDERLVVWGGAWVDRWGWDARRWRVAIPHLEVPADGSLGPLLPSSAQALWVIGAGESGAFGNARTRGTQPGDVVNLRIDSAPMAVRVWDARKRPASGVRLREASSPFQTAAVTDDEGRATVQVPTKAEWKIVAMSADSQGIRVGRGRSDREVDLDLEPRIDIGYRWPEELGTVVIHAGFESDPSHGGPRVFSDGVASLPKVAISGLVEYWGPGIASGRLQPSDSTGPVPLKARAAMQIEGRVVSATESSVAGLPVWMRISRSANSGYQSYGTRGLATPLERPWLPWAVTDSAGRFSIAGLPPGECEVEVRAPGFPAARSERLEGEPGAVLEITVTLRAGAALDLRVTDPSGYPLSGATVDLYRSAGTSGGPSMAIAMGHREARGDPELTAFTDEEGLGHLASVPVGAVRLRLSRPGSVSRTIDTIEVPAEGIDIGDQVLEPGVTLTGTTLGPDGEPVGEAEVALERNPQVPLFRVEVTSDEDGRFSIPDLDPSGGVYLQARAEGLVPEAPLKVELPPEGEIEVAMAEERILEGLVLDARSDSPVEGASVSLGFQRETSIPGVGNYGRFSMGVGNSQTDASGRFLFDGLWDGEFEIYAHAEGMRRVQQKVMIGAADPEPVVIRLEPGLELRGRVETADGEPAVGVVVTASPASRSRRSGMTDSSRTQSDADGRFHFDALGPGTQRVWARSEEGQSAQTTAEAGQPDEVVLRLPRGGAIRGTVSGPDGSPLAGARVSAYGSGVSQSVSDETGADGRFGLTDVGPGSWTVWASAEGLARASEDVEVPEGETVTVDLRLERGATVTGEILGLSASELESCMVRVDGGGRAGPTPDGAFRIAGVPSGERQVVAIEMTTRRSRSVGVFVPETGESERVVIDFAAGLTVYGRVLRGSTGVPGLTVSVHGVATAASGETVSGPDGGWRVEGLEPGEYQIAAHSRSGEVLAGDHVLLEVDTELDLFVSSGSVTGRVLEADTERPIEGAAVAVTGSSIPPVQRTTTSDAAGAFEVSDLGDGEYTVLAEARGRTPARQNIIVLDGAAHDVTLLLEGETTTVLVVREANGSPATRIWIQGLGGGVLGPSISSTCTVEGHCEVNDLPRGRWTLLVKGQGAALVVADVPRAEIPVQLRATGGLSLVAPADESGAAWQVRLSEAATGIVVPIPQWSNPGRGEWVPVRASGLELHLPEGAWRIEAYAPDGTLSTREAIVPGGGNVTVELE